MRGIKKTTTKTRSLNVIALEIHADWGKKMYFGAVPYVKAMYNLTGMKDYFYEDSADTIVLYFLANAQTWRGETARRIKAELKYMLKNK